ncbi:elongation factor P [Gilvimarinus agarilyticus]|uniref:Elongation factor P n=1 Tax=Reichenbachiella agariperforans TaxID=156994 RepID=A0A1M6W0M3_REIAG|nr:MULTISPECIES: elongation factor P [Reichenbachiella]MBU2885867.1 elongation factor P [Gilvimarinus agarilyticus]MBU2915250.1 elongation factor P [Reichenbachiella agariperforans]RJE70912.1 elongation factor P [Reichenbachiella sp. MSK19-1]SHK87233.1 elongation factor P [Reichenbachiella agariperforans]
MASTADFKNGMCIEYNHGLYFIIDFQHVKPGKGPAFVRTKLKNVKTGKVLDNTFTAGHKVNTARIERRDFQYLYKDDMGYNFMNTETYDQISLEETLIDAPQFLKDGDPATIIFHAEEELILGCELPQHVELEVTYTEPGLKGDTATNASKPATLETGAEIQVPLFVNEGDLLKIESKTGSYVERVKK